MKTPSRRGMTLIELLVATSLSVVLLAAVMDTFIEVARNSLRIKNYFEMEQTTTRGLERLGRELRMTQSIATSGSPITQVALVIPNPTGGSTHAVIYRLDPAARTFVRQADGISTVLIRDIQPGSFSFERYDLSQSVAANDYGTNQLQITMTLSPDNHGLIAATTKRVVSSRFVLRNR